MTSTTSDATVPSERQRQTWIDRRRMNKAGSEGRKAPPSNLARAHSPECHDPPPHLGHTGDPALPKVPISGSDADAASSSSSQPSNIGTVIVERRGSYLRPTRYLSGSSLYPDEDPNPQPINPRAIEQLTVEGPAPRMNPKGDTSVMRLEAIPGLVF